MIPRITLTGTHVYGPATSESDIDIIMLLHEAQEFAQALAAQGIDIYRTDSQVKYGAAGGFYYDIGILKFNIIIAESMYDLLIWKITTDKMKRVEPIHDRTERLIHFQSLFMQTENEFTHAAFEEALAKAEDPVFPVITCLECANLHEVLQHEAGECAMFQSALEQILEEETQYLDNASEGGDNPTESFAGKTAMNVLAAHAVSNEQFDHKRREPLPALPEPDADDDDIPF